MRGSLSIGLVAAVAALALPRLASSEVEPEKKPPALTLRLVHTTTAAVPAEPPEGGYTLNHLVTLALRNNLQVRVDDRQVEEAEALLQFATSQAYPRITATTLFGGPTPEARTVVRNDIETLTPASFEGDFNFGRLGITLRTNAEGSLPLYTFGKISQGKKAASKVIDAARHNRVATQAEVAMNVHRAFWTYQLTRTFLGSLKEGQDVLERVLKRIEELLDAESPQVTENDRLRLRYALATLAVRATEAQNVTDIALFAMRMLLGLPQDAPIAIAEADLDDLPEGVPSIEEVVAAARADRPELLALRDVVRATEEFAGLREAQLYPDFFIGALFQHAYTSNATNHTNPFIYDPFNFVNLGVGFGFRVELDIFQKLALLAQAEAQARMRAAQEELATAAVELDTRRIHVEIVGGYQRVEQLERANRTARGWLAASALAYDIGTGRADELIDAFLAWAASEAELQKTRFDTLLRLADLARATGRLVEAARAAR